jgi:hypothetical protein
MPAFLLKQWFPNGGGGGVRKCQEGRNPIKLQFLMSNSAEIILSALLNHPLRKYPSELLILIAEELAFGIFGHHLLANKENRI